MMPQTSIPPRVSLLYRHASRARRLLGYTGIVVLVGLLLAVDSLAAPGGGSSGFGGGGGSGGGGGGGFSGGGGGTGGDGGGVGFLTTVAIFLLIFAWGMFAAWRLRRRRRARARRVELASAEAADDDAYFSAAAVRAQAADLHRAIVEAWTDRDRDGLRAVLGPDLMKEWELRLDDFDRKGWHNVCELRAGPVVEYLGLVNREDDADDRVVVRLEAELRDVVIDRDGTVVKRNEEDDELTTLAEYWTLGRLDERWILLSIEQDAEGAHHLESPIVPSPWSDDERLHDSAVTELAVADAVPGSAIPEIVDLDYVGDARTQALDLAVVDGRFSPAVLEAAARRAVEAWAKAVDGEDAALERAATPAAARAMLYPGDGGAHTRLVVRGPRLRALRIAALDAQSAPPTMTVEAEITGRRYLEDRDTAAVLDGSKSRETTFTERWTMALGGDAEAPWRIVETAPVG
jgi:predicted lipid-binding transport protein (Tim44 family)